MAKSGNVAAASLVLLMLLACAVWEAHGERILMKKSKNDKKVFESPSINFSSAIVANGFVFLSGALGNLPDVDGFEYPGDTVQAHVNQTLINISNTLERAGTSLDRVVKSVVLLENIEDFAGMNEIYPTFFPKDPPVRTTIAADLCCGALVEIDVIALEGKGDE